MSNKDEGKLMVELQTTAYLASPQEAIKMLQLLSNMQPLEHHFADGESVCQFKFRDDKPYYEDKVKAVTPAMMFAIQMNTDESKQK